MAKVKIEINFSEEDVHTFTEHSNSNEWFMGRIEKEIMNKGYTKEQARKAINPDIRSDAGLARLSNGIAWWGILKSIRCEINDGKRTIKMSFEIPNK